MSMRERILCLLVCAVFGLVGGAVSNLGLSGIGKAEAQPNSGVTKAQRFVVVDSRGNTLAELGNDNGTAELKFYSDSKARSTLNNHAIFFYDSSGMHRLALGVFRPTLGEKDDSAALTMWDAKGITTHQTK